MNPSFDRPSFREVFLSQNKRLEVFFYTSNLDKFLQARLVFERVGLILKHFKSKSDPYSEDYTEGKERLLARAVNEILGSVGQASLFFVEDTSLRIDALSEGEIDFPGLMVKEWFARTSFEELDAELRARGGPRTVVVKSDIALHIPDLSRPVCFHGSTGGVVANTAPTFEPSLQYPWLTPHSFNGWFVPDGSRKRLGEMSFEESWGYDFRIKALVLLLNRLEEYSGILNLSSHAYSRRRLSTPSDQLSFLSPRSRILVVVGRRCAGKTTFGEYASFKHGLRFIEASSVVRMFKDEYVDENLNAFSLAARLLEERGPDVVAREIIRLFAEDLDQGVVITGFRTIEELEVIRDRFPAAKVVLVEASERTRFQRELARPRGETTTSLSDFKRLDSEQWKFGLLRVAEDFADVRLENEGTMQDYYRQIDAVITGSGIKDVPGITTDVHPRHESERNQLYRCLVALNEAGRPLTCDELEEATRRAGRAIRHNNVNKVLKRVPELARRLELPGNRVRYEILSAGRAYVRLMLSHAVPTTGAENG